MTIDPAVLDALLAAGASAEMIVAAVKADAAIETERKASKRAGNAERQRRFKAKNKPEGNAGNALPAVSNADPLSPNDIYSNPLTPPLEISNEISPPSLDLQEPTGEPPLSAEEILEAWNHTADRIGLPKAKLTPQRRRKLGPLIRQHTLEDFTEAIRAVERSPFLRGENSRSWRADFDFFLQPSSFTKLIEGSYDRAH